MKASRLSQKCISTAVSPGKTANCSPNFCRTDRKSHEISLQTMRAEIKEEMLNVASRSPNRNFINQKSQILLRIDNKLEAHIKRKITLQKMQSKMSILSMQSTKFKISRNKSMFGKRDSGIKLSVPMIPQLIQSRNTKLEISEMRKQHGRYLLNSEIQAFKSYLRIISLNHPKSGNERKSELLSRVLLEYFISADEKQVRKDLQQIKAISPQLVNCLAIPNHIIDLNILKKIDRDISKLVFNMCYEIYRKRQKGVSYTELVNINKEIEYTARRLNFLELALKTCFDLGKLYCEEMEYEKAFQEYTNALKLAIYLDNQYDQEIAIDKLGICKYYLGDSVSALYFHNNIHHLSKYDLNRIRAEYSNQDEIKRLIEQRRLVKKLTQKMALKEQKRKELRKIQSIDENKENLLSNQSFEQKVDVGEFTFVKENRNQFYPLMNNHELKNNLKKIIKIPSLRDKVQVLKKNLIKNDLIGTKKYCGQSYIVPTASVFCRRENAVERNEVCISHRSYNRNDVEQQMADIDQDSRTIVATLNYFINETIMNHQEVVRQVVQEQTEESQMDQSESNNAE